MLPANSTVTGVIAAASTYQTGDIINANQTSDVLVTIANAGQPVGGTLVDVNNARSVQFRNVGQAAQAVNNVLFDNVTEVGSFGSVGNSDLSITNADVASTYVLSNPTAQSATATADLAVTFLNAVGASTAKFSLSNVGFSPTSDADIVITDNVATSATIATSGTNFFNPQLGTSTTSLTVTGSGNNVVDVNAGNLTAGIKTISFATATGINLLDLGNFVTTGDTYRGGTGLGDTLSITPSGLGATSLNVSGFENLLLASANAAGFLAFAPAPNFNNVTVTAGTGTGVVTLLNPGTVGAFRYLGAGTAGTQTFSGLSTTIAGAASVNFSNAGVAASDYELGTALTFNGASSLNLNFADVASTSSNLDGDTINASALTTFTATGLGSIGSGTALTIANGANTLGLVDLSALASGAASRINVGNNSFTNIILRATNTAASSFIVGAESASDSVTFAGGAFGDVFDANTNSYVGSINFAGGGGNDVLFSNTASTSVITGFGDAGDDQLFAGAAADLLDGGANNDILLGLAGNDVLTGGSGVDKFAYTAVTNGVDIITDFERGAAGDNIDLDVIAAATTFTQLAAATNAAGTANGTVFVLTGATVVNTSGNAAADIAAINAAVFGAGTAAAGAAQIIVFNADTNGDGTADEVAYWAGQNTTGAAALYNAANQLGTFGNIAAGTNLNNLFNAANFVFS